jgi:predicted glycosyltransferase
MLRPKFIPCRELAEGTVKKIIVYSHDTYGLGNVRRMLAIAEHLVESREDVSLLLVSGSPMIQSFRICDRIDYIKLPAIRRVDRERYSARSLHMGVDQLVALRGNVIREAVASFEPDMILVDKKPLGVNDELASALEYSRRHLPRCRHALVLRDILDAPERTAKQWHDDRCDEHIRSYYDAVFVLGSRDVFDACREYRFAPDVCRKVRYCGYLARKPGRSAPEAVRQALGITSGRMLLVTPGGGEDGYPLIDAYVDALPQLAADGSITSVIVTGSDMPVERKREIERRCAGLGHVRVLEFVDDMMAYMTAADLIVSMGGYNTFCEIATAKRRAVIVPRAKPVLEQSIRAERFAARGLLSAVHPDLLSPATLASAVLAELRRVENGEPGFGVHLDMDALPRLSVFVSSLLSDGARAEKRLPRLRWIARRAVAPVPPSAFEVVPEVAP